WGIFLYLIDEQWDHRSSGCHNIPISGKAYDRSVVGNVPGSCHGNFFHKCLTDSHGIDRVGGFIRTETNNSLDIVGHSCINGILGPEDVGLCGFDWEKFTRGYLLQGGGMEYKINTLHSLGYTMIIPYVTNIEFYFFIF